MKLEDRKSELCSRRVGGGGMVWQRVALSELDLNKPAK